MQEAAIQYGSIRPNLGFIPFEIIMPFLELNFGLIMLASPGPSFPTPTRGFKTLWPWTSWSYCLMTHSLLQTFQLERIFNKSLVKFSLPLFSRSLCIGLDHSAFLSNMGIPSCKNSISMSHTTFPLYLNLSLLFEVKHPTTTASTSSFLKISISSFRFSLETERIILSWASDIQISV